MTDRLSVIICTHNRALDTMECIEAILSQRGDRSIQIVVIDSASDPAEADKLRAAVTRHREILLARLDQPGLSRARNQGSRLANGEWLAFVDDDAVPAPDWLSRAIEIAESAPVDVAIVGGRIVPRWPASPPPEVGKRWLMFLSCVETGSQPEERPECYGANLMVRKSSLLALGGFVEQLGRSGQRLLSGEETLLQQLLLERGERVVYDGRLIVEHKIGAERLRREWVRERAYWGGVTEVLVARLRHLPRPSHLHPVKVAVSIPVLALLSKLRDPESDRFIRRWYASGALSALRYPARFMPAVASIAPPKEPRKEVAPAMEKTCTSA